MLKKADLRDIVLASLMILAMVIVLLNPVKKEAAGKKLDLATFIPASFAGWVSRTYDTANYSDKWQSINELLVRTYAKEERGGLLRKVKMLDLVFEYSSDLRKNFSFHFPETCHRAAGNEIEFFQPLEIRIAPDKSIKAKCLFIKGLKGSPEHIDKLVVYWLVIDNKQYYQTFFIKLDQMLAGLLRRSKSGFLVRLDFLDNFTYDPKDISRAKETISSFVQDLYATLDTPTRLKVFGQ